MSSGVLFSNSNKSIVSKTTFRNRKCVLLAAHGWHFVSYISFTSKIHINDMIVMFLRYIYDSNSE